MIRETVFPTKLGPEGWGGGGGGGGGGGAEATPMTPANTNCTAMVIKKIRPLTLLLLTTRRSDKKP